MVGYSADDYLRFSADKETIYYSEPVYACEDAYVLPTNDNSEQWGVRSDGHWTYVNCLMYSFPPQGWKIHITSTIYDAQNVLYDVAEYLFVKSISFKYLSSRTCFIQANGKYADRLESGKFITIYPSSEHIFIQLLKDLKTIVCKYDDGPYILTDKQWQNSNVFFRYGALKPRFSNEKNVPVIVTPQGDLIPDKELPLYSLPSFVDEPIYVKENNYLNELPSINLAKIHGSVNWKKQSEDVIRVCNYVVRDKPEKRETVKPDGNEPEATTLKKHYYEMLRFFEYEMSESAGNIGNGSLLIVHGFSFGDKHIVHALKRALENRELLVIIVAYTDNDVEVIKRNLKDLAERKNLRFLCPKNFSFHVGEFSRLDLNNFNKIIAGKLKCA